jgi:hypothetical protein
MYSSRNTFSVNKKDVMGGTCSTMNEMRNKYKYVNTAIRVNCIGQDVAERDCANVSTKIHNKVSDGKLQKRKLFSRHGNTR